MKAAVFLSLVVLGSARIPLPPSSLLGIRNAGTPYIQNIFDSANVRMTTAMAEFNPIKDRCMKQSEGKVQACASCVDTKCEARAKKECEPKDWEKVLGKVIEFTKDTSKFVFEKVPKFIIKELPNKIIDITKDVGRFLKDKVLDKVVDLHKGVIDVGVKGVKEIGRFGERVGKEIGRAGEKVIDVVKRPLKEVGRFGTRVGKEIGRVFRRWGKRSLRGSQMIRLRRSAEPSCDDFKKKENVCAVYKQPAFCPACTIDPMKDCPGFAAAVTKVEQAEKDQEWMLKVPKDNSDYNLLTMSFEMSGASMVNVIARVELFGKQFDVNIGSINPYHYDQSGPLLAQKALEIFKRS